MLAKTTEDELDLATREFLKTYNSFRKAALELTAIINSIRKNDSQESKYLSKRAMHTHEFMVQMMDERGRVGEESFGIKCVAEEEKE
ncbi:hypothetical protein ACFLZG_04315 [Thermodesulfobacteriota bacterium]